MTMLQIIKQKKKVEETGLKQDEITNLKSLAEDTLNIFFKGPNPIFTKSNSFMFLPLAEDLFLAFRNLGQAEAFMKIAENGSVEGADKNHKHNAISAKMSAHAAFIQAKTHLDSIGKKIADLEKELLKQQKVDRGKSYKLR